MKKLFLIVVFVALSFGTFAQSVSESTISKREKQMEKKKLEERAAKARAQKEKEQAILNEIRMIRLAHIIHDTIAADRKTNRTDSE